MNDLHRHCRQHFPHPLMRREQAFMNKCVTMSAHILIGEEPDTIWHITE